MSTNLKRLIHLSVSVDGAKLRTATLNGIQYIVCPVISKLGDNVEWPINAPTPELIPSSVLSLSIADRNNRPVVMGHPQDDLGNYISANDPLILEKLCFGFTFSAKFEDGKVKSEMWLDPIRAALVGPDAVSVITRLQQGQMVEVSEGDYVLSEIREGEWNGKKYGAVWIACWADHLATLPEGAIGACSIEDGCGALRTSQGIKSQMAYIDVKVSALAQARKPTYTGTESTPWSKPTFADYIKYLFNGDSAPTSISKCSSDLLRRIASHSLLGDPEAKNFQDLTFYPVVNPSTGYLNENALRGVVAGRGSSGLSGSALTSAQEMATRLLNSEFSANIPPKDPKPTAKLEASVDKKKENLFKRMISSMSEALRNSMSNNDLRWKLYKAIEKVDPAISFVQDEDVATGIVTYTTIIRMGDYYSEESEWHTWQRTFTVDDKENVTVSENATEVEFFQGWKPVGEATPKLETTASAASANSESCDCHSKGDESMNRVSVINRLSASGGPFAGNKAALEAMTDAGLGELEKAYPVKVEDATNPNLPATPANPNPPVVPATPTTPTTPATPVNNPTSGDAGTGTDAGTQQAQQTVSLSREEYAKMLAASNAYEAQQQAKKAALVVSLSTAQTAFTMPDLQAMEMSVLEKMAQALKVDQPQSQASYVALPINSANRSVLRELPDPLGLKVHSLRPDGKQIEKAN
jgi:hypothetical protein